MEEKRACTLSRWGVPHRRECSPSERLGIRRGEEKKKDFLVKHIKKEGKRGQKQGGITLTTSLLDLDEPTWGWPAGHA